MEMYYVCDRCVSTVLGGSRRRDSEWRLREGLPAEQPWVFGLPAGG